ncbi:conserved hypothetical protein [Hymenobacter roseosalivarius DSM 11622]|uniref:Short chain amide porin n=1 Tax=Hymenobacter roseosalivarius DSM 11622 TaxID=645990 RepID=A0A1W1W3N6_9BACT|nr:hypothetical protein [Hymenobacter roseosalivarius]SMC00229.1 conserved hypothetical protein [Hymenobacter roseosalivarius DSM 11622]
MRTARYALAVSALLAAASASAQVQPPPAGGQPAPAPAPLNTPPPTPAPVEAVPYGAGMKVNISPDGSKYLRFISWHQVWTRYNENNEGSQRVPGKPQSNQLDFGLRRSRFLLLAQLNPRFLVLTHFGINNQNAVSGGAPNEPTGPGKKPGLFLHEATVEYKVNQYLNIGAGMHYQNGISRMTRASTLNFLAIDAPIVNWPTIDAIDQFARWLGVYAKGRVSKFDYAVSINDPFATNQLATPATIPTNVAQYNPRGTDKVYQGYFSYEFLDQEANLLPYAVGSYLGTKRVFNIGAGFLHNENAMFSRPGALPTPVPADPFATIPTRTHDLNVLSADVFFDTPLNKDAGTAFTAYGVYYKYDFGPNYVRNIGLLNPSAAGGSTPIPGAGPIRGNSFPVVGTGNAQYVQAGYLLPKNLLGTKARLQPYAAYLRGSYEGLRTNDGDRQGVHVFDAGANLLLDGHNAKLTLNYRARPDFTNPDNLDYKPEITLQTMVFL